MLDLLAVCRGSSGEQLIAMIQQEAKEWPSRHCYVIINNIDGAGPQINSCV